MKILLPVFILIALFSLDSSGAVRTWDGGGGDDNWRTAANWVDDIAPVSGDDLVFPAVALKYTTNNNFTFGSTVRSMTFEGGSYTVSGSPLLPQTITSGLTVVDGTQTINIILQLGAPQSFVATGPAAVGIVAGVLLGSRPLTIDGQGGIGMGLISGSGQIIKNGPGGGLVASATAYTGQVAVNQGVLIVDAAMGTSSVTVNAVPGPITFDMSLFGLSNVKASAGISAVGGLGGTGTVGPVNVINGAVSAGTLTAPNGILNTGNLNIGPGGSYIVKVAGPTAGQGGYDQLNVTGTVTLNNPELDVLPSVRLKRSIVIVKNDGTDPISGTFLNAPEGAVLTTTSGYRFRISYVGGDGNDIVLTRVGGR